MTKFDNHFLQSILLRKKVLLVENYFLTILHVYAEASPNFKVIR